jgi:MoCo/4Fe-4S cofactor protein with predicted Tat translocation signal
MNSLETSKGVRFWRSLEELEESAETREMLEREFPASALKPLDELGRRSFLKLMGASLAMAGFNGCTRQPIEQIVPYVRQPEEIVPGEPLYFATAMPLGGFGTGILVKSREGRPIKADGNPLHPATGGGGSSVWIQACLLDLYNPERAKTVTHFGQSSSFSIFLASLHDALHDQEKKRGAGLRLLTGSVTSPTLAAQIREVLEKFPEARWHQWEPINWDNALEGTRLAFGEPLATHYQIEKAAMIVSFESDFLYTHPQRLRYTREFTNGRRIVAGRKEMNRLYVVESSPTVTGSMADNRLPLSPSEIERAIRFLGSELGVVTKASTAQLPEDQSKWLSAVAQDLKARHGSSIVIVGESLSLHLHGLEQGINDHLGNFGRTVLQTAPAQAQPVNHVESFRNLVNDMQSGAVDLLLLLGGNPAVDAPADFAFAQALEKVHHTVHLSPEFNETSSLCAWHIPQTHFLEAWSDIRAFDGTVTIMQPLIAPLFGGKSEHELLGAVLRLQPMRSDYEIVREFWRGQRLWEDFETGWRKAVHDGLIEGTALPAKMARVRAQSSEELSQVTSQAGLEVSFRPDPHLWDGRFATNPWLQETPKPLTKLTWDNAVLISPQLAERKKLTSGDVVELQMNEKHLEAPVFILPGQAENTLTMHLGHGQKNGTSGFNFYPLRMTKSFWQTQGLGLKKTGKRYELVTTQSHHRIHGEDRQVYREGTLAAFLKEPGFVKNSSESPAIEQTLYKPGEYDYSLKWGMAIDLTTCIGCNACILACNIENNIPIVGKKQVGMNREMLWLRIDTYYNGEADRPQFNHQPVPCMHCENAPCEYVCPVEATVHDHEGLNLQVYNRCIGTRYCSNNCPYKVRRFNFFRYADYDSELSALRNNPEVTVRWRGVMEKCTYCVQRISTARINSKQQNRAIRDGEVKTACQEACPANAIVFGVMSDPESQVAKQKAHPLDFSMLGQLNTRPRTTYTAKLRNPNPELES